MRPLRRAVAGEIGPQLGSGTRFGARPSAPPGDAGLFGPGSVAWRVHGDFVTMMVGGVSALLLQMLHPAALAGVWDHSDFRNDSAGRLKRTAAFIGVTTYGSTREALELIGRVRSIHDRVHGTLPDGRPYSANDPALLTWVHVAGSWSFLQAYLRHGERLPIARQDLYFEETALIARKLGAADVPASVGQVRRYLADMQPSLMADGRTRIVADTVRRQKLPDPLLEPFRRLVVRAGTELLPDWAARMHGLPRPRDSLATRAAVAAARTLARLAPRG